MGDMARLIAAVEAGTLTKSGNEHWLAKMPRATWEPIIKANSGSLDAAKALHDALLPGWGADVSTTGFAKTWKGGRVITVMYSERIEGNPARAWLLAVLRALEAVAGWEIPSTAIAALPAVTVGAELAESRQYALALEEELRVRAEKTDQLLLLANSMDADFESYAKANFAVLRVTGPNSDGEYWLHIKADGRSGGINLGGQHGSICKRLLDAVSETGAKK